MNGIRTRKHTTKFSKINALISTCPRKMHVLKIDCQNFWESWSPCLAICFFFFCETRCVLGDIGLEGGRALYTNRESTNNAGVPILAHHQHNDRMVNVNELPTRVLCLRPRFRLQQQTHFVAAYTPNAGYHQRVLDEFYDDLDSSLENCRRRGYELIIGNGFNTQLAVGNKGRLLQDANGSFALVVSNAVQHLVPDEHAWTFESSHWRAKAN